MFLKKYVLKNFANFFFNKVVGLQAGLQRRCFPVKLAKFLRAPILRNIYKQLLLHLLEMGKERLFCERVLKCGYFHTATPKSKRIFGVLEELVVLE